jgi:hypothetical protein
MPALLALVLIVGLVPAQAAPPLPFVTGGGRGENNNSGGDPQNAYGGFVGRATAEGATRQHAVFGNAITVYPAEGEVQARSATVEGNETVIKVHGDVVCIANYGPSSGVDGGGNADEDVWEIRFRIERSDPSGFADGYSSLLVQDNGRDDYADENAEAGLFTNPECGEASQFELEPIQGQITVHD